MRRKLLAVVLATIILTGCSANEAVTEATTEATKETTVETTTATTEEAEVPEETEVVIPDLDLTTLPTFEVTSESATDGVWDAVISNTANGENLSPELSWEEVPDASLYVLYMIDVTAGNWVHMMATDITTNELQLGELDSSQYIGPYPPSGTHEYVVYVFALREEPVRVRGLLDRSNSIIDVVFSTLDVTEEGESGNIAAYGCFSATYSAE